MADPRFFENLGPFTLAQICEKAGVAVPAGAEGTREFFDLADLGGADSRHLTFFSGNATRREAFVASRAGACLVAAKGKRPEAPHGTPGYRIVGQHPSSDGYEWEIGLTVAPTTFGSGAGQPLDTTSFTVRLFAVTDD